MSICFNFSRLRSIYSYAWINKEPTIAFETCIGRGSFVFMIFFAPEDKNISGDSLFIYLRNVNVLLRLKLYGSRKNGVFNVYITPSQQQILSDELQLTPGGSHFSFNNFLNELNDAIPQTLSFKRKIETIRTVWPKVCNSLNGVIDDAHKTILIGIKKLPEDQRPREKTLRKLFTCTNSPANDVQHFIDILKKHNYTLMWTSDQSRIPKSFAELINKII